VCLVGLAHFSDSWQVNVLLFLVSLSEYNQVRRGHAYIREDSRPTQTLYEDQSVSRISEAMTLFDSISNSRWFTKSTLILFLK
jgi:guanine nucleotide-binding protein G(i) subunit alpha